MDDARLQVVIAAIRAMNTTSKPTVKAYKTAVGKKASGDEIAAAWKYIAEHPVDEDIPQNELAEGAGAGAGVDSGNDDDETETGNQPKDSVTVHIALSTKAIKSGLERRCRAGHCFDKTGKAFSAGEIDETAIKTIAADPYLTLKSED